MKKVRFFSSGALILNLFFIFRRQTTIYVGYCPEKYVIQKDYA